MMTRIKRVAGLGLILLMIVSFNVGGKNLPGKSRRFEYRGFSGGMMVHTGYMSSDEFTIVEAAGEGSPVIGSVVAKGMPTGIGGAMKFSFGKHLRLGTEGYVSNLTYGEHNNSRISVGWGGILADVIFEREKFSPFVGMTVGGGRVRNMTLFDPTPEDFIAEATTSYRTYSLFVVTPFVGMEYAMTPKVRLTLKIDYMIRLSQYRSDFIHGPRVYIGFMFDRTK